MANTLLPMGTATGPGWQYRIERDGTGIYSPWRDWTDDPEALAFTEDPSGGDLDDNAFYWLYARNAFLPAGQPGAIDSELAAPLKPLPSTPYFSLYFTHVEDTHTLTVSAESTRPLQYKLVDTGWSGDWVNAGIVQGNYVYVFPGVTTSGRLFIRAVNESGPGTSVPVVICECEPSGTGTGLDPLEKTTDPTTADVGPGLTRIITNTTTGKTELVYNRAGTLLCVPFSVCGATTPPPTGDPVVTRVITGHYEDIPVVNPVYTTGRVDAVKCDRSSGWLTGAAYVRIERDGQVVARVYPSIPRPDVYSALAGQGHTPDTNVLGWVHYKTGETGTHSWNFYIEETSTALSTDVPAEAPGQITCGTTTETNPVPVVNNPFAGITLTQMTGSFTVPEDEFRDNAGDTGTLSTYRYDPGTQSYFGVLPPWLSYNASTRTFSYDLNGWSPDETTLQRVYTDSAQQSASYEFVIRIAAASPSITKVAYDYTKNNPAGGVPNVLNVYVKSNSPLEFAIKADSGYNKSAYTSMNAGTYPQEYNRKIANAGLAQGMQPTLYFRVPGQSTDLLVVPLPVIPGSSVAFTQVYPSGSTGLSFPLTTPFQFS